MLIVALANLALAVVGVQIGHAPLAVINAAVGGLCLGAWCVYKFERTA